MGEPCRSDLWQPQHERAISFVDDANGSKVLISSRVRAVLEGAAVVEVDTPSEADAVQILLGAAGWPQGALAPGRAVDVVRFCSRLPLTLGIAGAIDRAKTALYVN